MVPLLPAAPPPPVFDEPVALPEATDPLAPELEKERRELGLPRPGFWRKRGNGKVSASNERPRRARWRAWFAPSGIGERRPSGEAERRPPAALPLSEIVARSKLIAEEITALKQAAVREADVALSHPGEPGAAVRGVDVRMQIWARTPSTSDSLVEEVGQNVKSKGTAVRDLWDFSDVTPAVGAFRLRYRVEREATSSRLTLAEWIVEPVTADRGETAETARTAPGSAFRKVIDALDPQQTAVTFWVYPDSFPLYRKLRDLLHERDLVVAGRPLPDGVPIRSTKHGSASRRTVSYWRSPRSE